MNCPINYISENKLSNNYSSVLIGNKTFYYGNNITTKRKIIAGLVVDTDLYLNQDNDKKDLIDNYTISEFLEDNQNLYKNCQFRICSISRRKYRFKRKELFKNILQRTKC